MAPLLPRLCWAAVLCLAAAPLVAADFAYAPVGSMFPTVAKMTAKEIKADPVPIRSLPAPR